MKAFAKLKTFHLFTVFHFFYCSIDTLLDQYPIGLLPNSFSQRLTGFFILVVLSSFKSDPIIDSLNSLPFRTAVPKFMYISQYHF